MFRVIESNCISELTAPRSVARLVSGCTVPATVTIAPEVTSWVIRLARWLVPGAVCETSVAVITRTAAHTANHRFRLITSNDFNPISASFAFISNVLSGKSRTEFCTDLSDEPLRELLPEHYRASWLKAKSHFGRAKKQEAVAATHICSGAPHLP